MYIQLKTKSTIENFQELKGTQLNTTALSVRFINA